VLQLLEEMIASQQLLGPGETLTEICQLKLYVIIDEMIAPPYFVDLLTGACNL
jgi:hypothetical protein